MNPIDPVLLFVAVALLASLLVRRVRDSRFWQATVTPLASIIGSGFLIVAPLLGTGVGRLAPWAMLLIVVVTYFVGSVIRFNIVHAEPLLANGNASAGQRFAESLSDLGLFAAYVVSVAFYLRLLSAFVLRGLGMLTETNARTLTTLVLAFIAVTGWRWGLKALERLEEYSVTVKLAIIGALLVGLGAHDAANGWQNSIPSPEPRSTVEVLRMLAGMLLVTQGFETSRYLGAEYPADMRVRSMRLAQALAGVVYVAFAFLILPLIPMLPAGKPDETAIIDLSRHVALVLPAMLVVAAVMSQFSAAVADTLGGGGLAAELTAGRVPQRRAYAVIAVAAAALVWTTNIFEIVAYASRVFAFYYFAQTLLALQVAARMPGAAKVPRLAGFGLMAAALAWVVIFAVPVA